MKNKRYAAMMLAFIGLVASILACNAPTPASEVAPTSTTQAVTETSPPAATEPPSTATPTLTAIPTPTTTPTPTPSVTPGPLDFVPPTALDDWVLLPDGKHVCTITLQIAGGVPTYTVEHISETFTTLETSPTLAFTARGCSGIVHSITVESADGQTVTHDYWIPPPWCE